jgi:hypothetical protein
MKKRDSLLPWLIVGAGALVFWSVALGLGVRSLARVLGPVHKTARLPQGCLEATYVDGRTMAFGDCLNVHFIADSPEIPRPFVPSLRLSGGCSRSARHVGPHRELASPAWRRLMAGEREPREPYGRTAY